MSFQAEFLKMWREKDERQKLKLTWRLTSSALYELLSYNSQNFLFYAKVKGSNNKQSAQDNFKDNH